MEQDCGFLPEWVMSGRWSELPDPPLLMPVE